MRQPLDKSNNHSINIKAIPSIAHLHLHQAINRITKQKHIYHEKFNLFNDTRNATTNWM